MSFREIVRERHPTLRRVARGALAFAIALAVVVVSAERGTGTLGPWSGFVGMIGLVVVVVGLVQGDVRVFGAAVAVLATSVVLGGNGQLHGASGAFVTAALGVALLLVVEIGLWSAEARGRDALRGPDTRRVGLLAASALSGGAIGGLAVFIAATTTSTAGGIILVAGAALATCLVAALALLLATQPR